MNEDIKKLMEQMPRVENFYEDAIKYRISHPESSDIFRGHRKIAFAEATQAQREADAKWIQEQEEELLNRLGVKTVSLEEFCKKRHKLLDEYAKQQGLVRLLSGEELYSRLCWQLSQATQGTVREIILDPSFAEELLRWLRERG